MVLALNVWRSEKNNATPSENVGYPITTAAPQSGTFPTITSAGDAIAQTIYRKVNLQWQTDVGKEALLGRVLQFNLPDIDSGLHYSTFVLAADQAETEADQRKNRQNEETGHAGQFGNRKPQGHRPQNHAAKQRGLDRSAGDRMDSAKNFWSDAFFRHAEQHPGAHDDLDQSTVQNGDNTDQVDDFGRNLAVAFDD